MKGERKILSERVTIEVDPEDHKKALDEVNERYSDPLAIMSVLQAIRADQINSSQDRKSRHSYVANALAEQNASVNRLSTDVAGLSVRTATIEVEQQKHSAMLGQVKERQDGCAARITHDQDNTEIRDLRAQLQKAVWRRLTPPFGVRAHHDSAEGDAPAGSWWMSNTGKAVLTALAGLLVAVASIVVPWTSTAPGEPQLVPTRPPVVRPVRSVPIADKPIYGYDSDPDDTIDTARTQRGAVSP